MGQNSQQLPTLAQIKELLSFLPKLHVEGFSPVKEWKTYWPDYEPVVLEFFHILSQPCWSDYNYTQFEHRDKIRDEDFAAALLRH